MGRRAGIPVVGLDAEHGAVYQYRFTVHGKRKRGSTGLRDYEKALAWANDLYADMLKGRKPPPNLYRYRGAKSKQSLTLLFAQFVASLTGKKSASYVEKFESHFRAHFQHRWETLDDILEPGAIDKYATDRLNGKAPAVEESTGRKRRKRPTEGSSVTVAKELVTLRRFLKWCKKLGHIEQIPVWETVKPISDYAPPDYTPEDARAILAALPDRKTHRRHFPNREFFTVQWAQGLRPGELGSLRWQDVNLKRREMTVRQSEDKARVGRVLPLVPEAFDVLEELHAERNPLPSSPVFGEVKFQRALDKAAEACGLPRPTPHHFRHFRLTELGHAPQTPPAALQFFAGHKHLSTTDRYLRSRTRAAKAMLDALPIVSRSVAKKKTSRGKRLPDSATKKGARR